MIQQPTIMAHMCAKGPQRVKRDGCACLQPKSLSNCRVIDETTAPLHTQLF